MASSLRPFSLRQALSVLFLIWSSLLAAAAPAVSLPGNGTMALEQRQTEKRQTTATSKLVFAHFLVGIVSNRKSAADYDADMKRAKAVGIDAFALNIGTDSYTDQQLQYAYTSAARNGMKVFISFDFSYWNVQDPAAVGRKIKQYASQPAQLKIGSKVFASSFLGTNLNVPAMRTAAGVAVFWAPNAAAYGTSVANLDGALNWGAWPNNGANRAPTASANYPVEAGDATYKAWLGTKPYIAPVSPWFFTHFGREVSWSKNWVFPSDLLWLNRWKSILNSKPQFVEILSWNDYGESHYVAPLSSKHTDDGSSKWAKNMPHNGWLDMAQPFIAAYKAGATMPEYFISAEKLIYWYRPTPKNVNCDGTDNAGTKPDGWNQLADSVFVVTFLTAPSTLTVSSGSNVRTFSAPAGITSFQVPMGLGVQSFLLKRGSRTIFSGQSPLRITNTCPCGIYNYNAYVGTLNAGAADALDSDGLAQFKVGLKSGTCTS